MRFAKSIAAVTAVGILALGGWSYASPKLAAKHLREVARAGDREALRDAVDFPAVREGLKEDLKSYLTTQMQDDPEMRDNPFAGLGLMFAGALVDRMVEGMVTPSSIALLASGGKPNLAESGSGAARPDPEANATGQYRGFSRYVIVFKNRRTGEAGPTLVFERGGLSSWRLVRVDLPLEEAAKEQKARRAEASLKSDLKNLQAAEEIFYSRPESHYTYTANLAALDFVASTGNTVSVIAATARGFAATGYTQEGGPNGHHCVVFVGEAPHPAPASQAGVIACE